MAKPSKPLPSQEMLKRLLDYDKETGKLFWKARTIDLFTDGAMFTAAANCAKWNTRWAGKEALTKLSYGYPMGRIFYAYYSAHRVIWKWVTGEEPKGEIDHINGVRFDNRWANLRDVTSKQNLQNLARRGSNKSGTTGVFWDRRTRKWVATIQVSFDAKEAAIAARQAMQAALGFHPNHGRSAALV